VRSAPPHLVYVIAFEQVRRHDPRRLQQVRAQHVSESCRVIGAEADVLVELKDDDLAPVDAGLSDERRLEVDLRCGRGRHQLRASARLNDVAQPCATCAAAAALIVARVGKTFS
jgi:hypothetical protein